MNFQERMQPEFYCQQVREQADAMMGASLIEPELNHHLDYLRGMTAGFWIAGVISTVDHVKLFDHLTQLFNERVKAIRAREAA